MEKNEPDTAQMVVTNVLIEDLVPDAENPRVNMGAVEVVAESIRQFGFRVPLVIDTTNKIIAGHTRYRAAIMLGMKELPCTIASDLTDQQLSAFSVAENRTSDFSFFDVEKLSEFVQDIPPELLVSFDIDSILAGGVDSAEDELASTKAPEKRNGLDLAPFERYQYVMVMCRTEHDYLNLLDRLGLEDKQKAYIDGVLKRGSSYGRVIEYPEFLSRIQQDQA